MFTINISVQQRIKVYFPCALLNLWRLIVFYFAFHSVMGKSINTRAMENIELKREGRR